jgi:predicted DCC family thiol-disulfide oxidoreductase YuxK
VSERILVYDDDCGFCTWWAEFFEERADLRLVGYSEVEEALRERLPRHYEDCSHLVTEDAVYSCGQSFEEAFVRSGLGRPVRPAIDRLREVGPYNDLRELGYRWVAGNRSFWGRVLSKTPPARERRGTEE